MKVLVFGNSGSGKSTYARALAAREGLAHLDSDSIVWGFGEPDKIAPGKIAVQRPDEAVALLFEASLIHTLPGSLKAATANWFEQRRLIARCWFSLTLGSMRVWRTISNGPGSHISMLRSSFKTPCLINFKSG